MDGVLSNPLNICYCCVPKIDLQWPTHSQNSTMRVEKQWVGEHCQLWQTQILISQLKLIISKLTNKQTLKQTMKDLSWTLHCWLQQLIQSVPPKVAADPPPLKKKKKGTDSHTFPSHFTSTCVPYPLIPTTVVHSSLCAQSSPVC